MVIDAKCTEASMVHISSSPQSRAGLAFSYLDSRMPSGEARRIARSIKKMI